MEDRVLVCPNHCRTEADTPFYYPSNTYETDEDRSEANGVLAYPDGTPSNRFEDGIAGVPKHIIDAINASDELPACIECHDQAEWEPVVKVVFRKWNKKEGGGIIALFPELLATDKGDCESYEHIGQHGPADYTAMMQHTTPAKPEEYAALKKELESSPYYYHLRVVQRAGRKITDRRIGGVSRFLRNTEVRK